MLINHLSKCIRYTGRWAKREDASVTTATGSAFEIAFFGRACDLIFDTKTNAYPRPHLYVQVDGGAKVDVRLSSYIRIDANQEGNHVIKVIFKCMQEDHQRWYEPLAGKVSFMGAEADGEGVLPDDDRKVIEFIGDSITEGVWVDESRKPYGSNASRGGMDVHINMEFQNDVTGTYAYLTAEELDMRPCIMGYGCLGLTNPGNGGVPIVSKAYPFCFNNNPAEPSGADIIVINHGANDICTNASAEAYTKAYTEFLDIVRKINPDSKIVALSAFMGCHPKELGEAIAEYNKSHGEHIYFIDSAGWIPKNPIHPLRDGHKIISQNLVAKLKELGLV